MVELTLRPRSENVNLRDDILPTRTGLKFGELTRKPEHGGRMRSVLLVRLNPKRRVANDKTRGIDWMLYLAAVCRARRNPQV